MPCKSAASGNSSGLLLSISDFVVVIHILRSAGSQIPSAMRLRPEPPTLTSMKPKAWIFFAIILFGTIPPPEPILISTLYLLCWRKVNDVIVRRYQFREENSAQTSSPVFFRCWTAANQVGATAQKLFGAAAVFRASLRAFRTAAATSRSLVTAYGGTSVIHLPAWTWRLPSEFLVMTLSSVPD